jgi:CRP-like cAMP-binding protein
MSRSHTTSASYWGEVHSALSELEANRISALDGFTEDEAARCLEKSTIIECQSGDRVLKQGGVARNLFVVLDGTLEVREGDTVHAVLGPGDVFGEMAFAGAARARCLCSRRRCASLASAKRICA